MKPIWEKMLVISPSNSDSKFAKLTIEQGVSQLELVLLVGDERVVLATKSWRLPAFELAALIQLGAEKLQALK